MKWTASPALVFSVTAGLLAPVAGAQQGGKPLTQADWDIWRSIAAPAISNDGHWAVYSAVPQVGDGELVARRVGGSVEYRVPRGFIGRPQTRPGAVGDSSLAPAPARISADSRFVLALTYASREEFERTRRLPPARQPKPSLAILRLQDGNVTRIPGVRSFRMPEEAGRWAAYLIERTDSASRPVQRDSGAAAPAAPAAAPTPGATPRPVSDSVRGPRREYGTTLVLRDLETGRETRIEDVSAFAFDDSAKWLAYTVSSRTKERDGAYVRALGAGAPEGVGAEVALLSGFGVYRQLAFDRAGSQVAFLSDREQARDSTPRHTLYHVKLASRPAAATALVTPASLGDSVIISPTGRVEFTRAGNAILLGLAPPPLDSISADSLRDKAIVDIWHWQDPRLQTQQRVEAARDRNRSHVAVYQLGRRRLVRLASDSLPQVTVSDDARVAMGVTSVPYQRTAMWGESGNDVYAIDAQTGARRLVRERAQGRPQLSPGGRYILFFDEGRWFSWSVERQRLADLTGALRTTFVDEEWDTPDEPEAYGLGGWTEGDRSVLVYDRYDVWELDPAGARPPRMLTDSAGRRGRTELRVVQLDRDARFLDAREPLLLRAFDEETKASGFWRDRLGVVAAPERIVMADVRFGMPQRAKDAEQYLVTRSTFTEFPDLHAGPSLTSLARISNVNPQQSQYAWGSVELVSWLSTDGKRLQGLLYKPAGFDASRKYPMVTYFYERISNNLHQYHAPFGRNIINPSHYASNGYLVFMPDIVYERGYPGPSAMKAIIPGVQSIVARGFVDPEGLGIQGQSWGGYQAAYIITQTPMFRAAMAGAPVANMFSAYGGIRWQSGMNRAFQYERGQSRIGGSIWQNPLQYIENSPLFWLERVQTPLLIMHNDADGAVPWYQGIELFVGLRRLNKEVYLLNYNADEHNPTKRANQLDVARRMEQFFDHHLRGRPAPEWMEKGVPYQMKGRDQFPVASQP